MNGVEQEIRDLVERHGRITFARFMQACLYSRRGGFYASRTEGIDAHFGTSSMAHPAFGALIARQLEQMWHLLGEPRVFDVVEVGCGDGSLARSIVDACRRHAPGLARALHYVASDYAPRWTAPSDIQRVQAAGLSAFRNVVGCILSNELIDNFPVHRFAVYGGRIREVFVTSVDGRLTEVLGEPSSPQIEERLTSLSVSLEEGFRGEVNLALEDWTQALAAALDRGFVLTIDYGGLAGEVYSPRNKEGTLVCYQRHAAGADPYAEIGEQDITCHVDFTSLMRIGARHGLAAAGYGTQSEFLTNLGFSALLDEIETADLSDARRALERMAMMALVQPEEYGDLNVLVQAKGTHLHTELQGFVQRQT